MANTYTKPTIGSSVNAYSSTTTTINSTARPRLLLPLIEKLDPMKVPLQSAFAKGKAIDNPKIEWTDEVFGAVTATVDGSSYNSAVTTVNVASGHGARIQVYAVLRTPNGENLWVSAVSTDALTVTRGFGGTTAAAIAAAATLQIVGSAVPERVTSPAASIARGSSYFNYIQQVIRAIEISKIQNATNNSYLIKGREYPTEMARQMMEALRDWERTLFYGAPQLASSTLPWACGGFPSFITTQTSAKSGAAFTENDFLTLCQSTWDNVAENMGLTIISNKFAKRVVSSWVDDMRRMDAQQTRVKMQLDSFTNDFGTFDFLQSFHCPTDSLYLVDPGNITQHPYEDCDWQEESLAVDRASKFGHVLGVYTVVPKGDRAHAKLTGFSTTATDYPTLVSA